MANRIRGEIKEYDIIIVGTGAGNIVLEHAMEAGLKAAQVEKGKFGGTCLTRGCIPTKVMVTATEMLREFKEADKIGVKADNIHLDWKVLSERVWNKIDESKGLEKFYLRQKNLDVYRGVASFIDNKTMEVELSEGTKQLISADKIILNVGGRTRIPEVDGLEEAGYVTSETFFGEKYPKEPYRSLGVIGGGPIGTEFASTFSALGTEVKIIQRNVRLVPKEDEEISAAVLEHMKHNGIEVFLNKAMKSVRVENGKKIITIADKTTQKLTEVAVDEILIASGVVSNGDLLNFENTDIKVDKNGWIMTNEFLETSVEGIWAVGDINGRQQFRHKANYEADIVSHNLFVAQSEEEFRWAEYNLVPAVTFCYPEVAHIGLTEKEAVERGYEIQVGVNNYYDTAKGYALGYEPGDALKAFFKVIIDKNNGRILGAHGIGKDASIMIQPYLNLMNAGRHSLEPINEEIGSERTKRLRREGLKRKLKPHSFDTVRETMVPHPTLAEIPIWTKYYMKDK